MKFAGGTSAMGRIRPVKGSARVMMKMVDIGTTGIDTGATLRMVYRIREKDRQRGDNRYFWKSTPPSAA